MSENSQDNKTVVVVQNSPSPVIGILSIVFGIVAMFLFAIVFVPLGLIFGIIAIFKKQVGLGITGIVLSLIAAWLSPTFWVLFGSATIAAH